MAGPEIEAEVRALVEAGDVRRAAEIALDAYGPELLGYLFAMLRAEQPAHDVFAELCAHVWRDLPKFRWQSSLRTWAYAIARNRLYEYREAEAKRRRLVPLSQSPEVEALVARARTATQTFLRTDVKERVAVARAALDEDDRTLLILRVDRNMAWADVGEVLGVPAATARKRFERVKQRLRELLT
jgi:RNA polymerase sigma-70 factor (ECF subfamily)